MHRNLLGTVIISVVLSLPYSPAQAAGPAERSADSKEPSQQVYRSPEAAAQALADAIGDNDLRKMRATLGPASDKLIQSGDPVEDERSRERFLDAYKQAVKIERQGDGSARVFVGDRKSVV